MCAKFERGHSHRGRQKGGLRTIAMFVCVYSSNITLDLRNDKGKDTVTMER